MGVLKEYQPNIAYTIAYIQSKGLRAKTRKPLKYMVSREGIEPSTY